MKGGCTSVVFLIALVLCHCLVGADGRRTTSTSRRGQSSRGNNYGNPSQGTSTGSRGSGGFFTSFFGSGTKKSAGSGGSSSSTTSKKSGTSGWSTASQASKTSSSQSGWANPYYKPSAPPKQPVSYGWAPAGGKKPEANQFQRSGQPSSNIGPGGYPVQSGVQRTPQQTHGFNVAQQPHGYNTGLQSHGYNTAHQTHGYNTAQQPHGYGSGTQSHGYGQGQHGYNPSPQTHGYNQPHGYSTAPQSHGYGYNPASQGYNSNYHPPSYGAPTNSFGGYHPPPQGFASSHGISPSYYPSQNSFGYPGQGIFGGSHGPKYGGLNIFGGGTGNFGYPGSSGWNYPSYGSKRSSGTGKLLTGLALGAAGGYLTNSLIHKISNPWGYSGWGYGSRFGYDRPIIIKEIRETTKTETPAPPAGEPDPTEKWIHCIAFDPTTNVTLINPNCSCTVTTVIDPMTGLPISTHNCTTANGQVLPPHPIGMPVQPPLPEPVPPNAVNNPNASPAYGGLYQDTMRYGMAPPGAVSEVADVSPPAAVVYAESSGPPSPQPTGTGTSEGTSTVTSDGTTTEGMVNDGPGTKEDVVGSSKVKEFYSQLEEIVNMGKFA